MTVLLLISLKSYQARSQTISSSTGKQLQSDTSKITVPIIYIKDANAKLIERLYLLKINKQQDSIINLNKLYINEQSNIIKDFQNKVVNITNDNNKLKTEVVKQKNKSNIFIGTTVISLIVVTITLLIK